jgi:transposase
LKSNNGGENYLREESTKESSGLGKAIRYFIKHYDGLSCFFRIEGVKLDNNAIEAMLKIVVRDRKNTISHKTLLGATIGDVLTSMIALGSEAGTNVFEYAATGARQGESEPRKSLTLELSASHLIRHNSSKIR